MNDRFKFRVWDKYIQSYIKENLAEECVWIEDDGQLGAGIDDSCILEQCTGLKDKNGNMIYEGDVVKDSLLGREYTVNWDCDDVQFEATANIYDTELSEVYGLYVDSAKDLEIVGNIHEQSKQNEKLKNLELLVNNVFK